MNLEQVKERLQGVNLQQLSYKAELPVTTILSIREGKVKNPGILTLEKIVKGLDALDTAEGGESSEKKEDEKEVPDGTVIFYDKPKIKYL